MSKDARDWAWRQSVPPTVKLVLLALAERTNGDCVCWPSIHYLACATGLSDRTVQKALRSLVARALIHVSAGGGRAANRYALQLANDSPSASDNQCEGCSTFTREPDSPAYEVHRRGDTGSPDGCPTVTAGVSDDHPNRNGTVIEPPLNPKRMQAHERVMALPSWIEPETWQAFLDHRRCIKAPMSEIAQQRAITMLERLRDEGQNPDAVLNQSIVNGWKGLFPVKTGSPGAPSAFDSNVRVLHALFGEEDGQKDIPGGAGVSGGGVRHPAPARADGRVLGPTRRAAR